jgi:hypothetical protein
VGKDRKDTVFTKMTHNSRNIRGRSMSRKKRRGRRRK